MGQAQKVTYTEDANVIRHSPMTDVERARLWQQRLFEAEAGMTGYLVNRRATKALYDWIQVQSRIFENIPKLDSSDHLAWQHAFFRGQALLEQFMVAHFGHAEIAQWAQQNAQVYAAMEPDRGGGAADVMDRLRRQLDNYGSVLRVLESTSNSAAMHVVRCGIWDYRERARSRGVFITLKSPCEYCTKATSANIREKGYEAEFELIDDGQNRGCRWLAHVGRARTAPMLSELADGEDGDTLI